MTQTQAQEDNAGLLRPSRVMAAGTLVSRATGLIRNIVILSAIGAGALGDAYNIANTLPNIVYELLLGGVLTSVVVPLIVEAAQRDDDGGDAYAQRLLTLVAIVLGTATTLAVLAAPAIIGVYQGRGVTPQARDLAATFGRFFLPQIVFYGIGATMGAILNTRGRFGAPMWAPVLNNLVVIATGIVFIGVTTSQCTPAPGTLSTAQLLTLGIGTTLGIVVQTVALVPSLRASGFRWRPRFDFRNTGLRQAARLAGWVVLYVVVNQIAYVAVTKLAASALYAGGTGADALAHSAVPHALSAAGHHAAAGSCPAPTAVPKSPESYTDYTAAFMIFQLPHAVVAVSVITALLPRMSRLAVSGATQAIGREISRGLRVASVVLVPATFAYVALHQPVVTTLLRHGHVDDDQAGVIGWTLAAFAVGLVPFSAFQLQLRGFYALRDTRTPALINIWVNAANIVVDIALFLLLPNPWKVPGLALGYATSYIVGLVLSARALGRRVGGLDGYVVTRTIVRLSVASLGGAALAYAVAAVVKAGLGSGFEGSALALLLGIPAGGALYLWVARRLRVAEVDTLVSTVTSRLPGRSHHA